MIHVIATVQLEDGRRDDFLQEFHKVVPDVLAEAGCLEYGPTVDVETNFSVQPSARKNAVVILEKWESIDALEAHLIAPHMLAYREKVKPFVTKVDLQILAPA